MSRREEIKSALLEGYSGGALVGWKAKEIKRRRVSYELWKLGIRGEEAEDILQFPIPLEERVDRLLAL